MNCTNCTATTNGVSLCVKCDQTLTVALTNVAAYHADVVRIQPGQRVKVRGVPQSTPPGADEPALFDRIGQATEAVENALTGWQRMLTDDRAVEYHPPRRTADSPPGLDVRHLCAWLEQHRRSIVTLEWAGEMLRDVLACERKLKRIIDNADTGWWAGVCGNELAPERVHDDTTCGCGCHHGYDDCDAEMGEHGCGREFDVLPATTCERGLYATVGVNWIRCPECGRSWDVAVRREAMMREARETLAPVRAVARIVVALTDEASVERVVRRIEKWIDRNRLHDLGVRVIDKRPRRVYRVGDVIDLIRDERPRTDGSIAS